MPVENFDNQLVACRPIELDPKWPYEIKEAFRNLAPLEDGAEAGHCELCGEPIMIGPRQLQHIKDHPETDIVCCMICGVKALAALGGSMDDISHLGGK